MPEVKQQVSSLEVDAFLVAAENGDLKEIERILSRCPSIVSERDENGWSALHRAAIFGQVDCAKFLIQHGAKIDIRDSKGNTPLHDAAQGYWGSEAIALILLRHGANIEACNCKGCTPLIVAAAHSHLAVASFLVGAGANPLRQDRRRMDAISHARYTRAHAKGRKYTEQRWSTDEIIRMLDVAMELAQST